MLPFDPVWLVIAGEGVEDGADGEALGGVAGGAVAPLVAELAVGLVRPSICPNSSVATRR